MSRWPSLTSIFGKRAARGLEAQVALTAAYRNVFQGSPTRQEQNIVLADLAAKSGFYGVSSSSLSSDALRQREGMRELFSVINRHLTLTAADVHLLENAARIEMATDNNE